MHTDLHVYEIMDVISMDQGDTYPFPNARFALLYLLLHSPRPMVYDLF